MGFNNSDLKFLLSRIDGKSICMLGRLNLFMSRSELSDTLRTFHQPEVQLPDRALLFAEDVLKPLGFSVDSVDASAYENATIIHDLNDPLPEDLIEKFDIVWDGGTLEHVFDYPTALASAMRMVKIGGHMAFRTPANNQCGHGFYQFSPELFFRLLVPDNGFEIVRIYLASGGKHYHVLDPANARGRVELLDNKPALLMVHAMKIGITPTRLRIPQQSDYAVVWNETERVDSNVKAMLRRVLSDKSIVRVSKVLNNLRQRRNVRNWKNNSRLNNRRFYLPVKDWRETTAEAFLKAENS